MLQRLWLSSLTFGLLGSSLALAAPRPHAAQPRPRAAAVATDPAPPPVAPRSVLLVPLDVPDAGGLGTSLFGVNRHGVIVGNFAAGDRVDGFIFEDGAFTDVNPPGAVGFSELSAINDAGFAVGDLFDASGADVAFVRAPDGTITRLPEPAPGVRGNEPNDINSRGEIVGQYGFDTPFDACTGYLFAAGAYHVLAIPGATCIIPRGLDDRDDITGSWTDSAGLQHGFVMQRDGGRPVWDHPRITDITISGHDTAPWRINQRGEVVGYYSVVEAGQAVSHGFVRRDGQVRTLDYPGAFDTNLLGLTDAGLIVGTFDGFSKGLIAVPVGR